MKEAIRNVLGGWITTIIGTATMVVTLFLVYKGTFTFVWEGIGGLVAGCMLLLAPETIEKKVSDAISVIIKKNNQQQDI
jgi:hypothetical protein